MHILSEVDTTRIANIIVNEVGIIDEDSKRRILEALDIFIRSKVGDFNRVSKVLDDTLLAYKDLLQQQRELCATISNLRSHTKQLLTQVSVLSNRLAQVESHLKGVDSKVNLVVQRTKPPIVCDHPTSEDKKDGDKHKLEQKDKSDEQPLTSSFTKGPQMDEIVVSTPFGDEVYASDEEEENRKFDERISEESQLKNEESEDEEPPQFVKDLISRLEKEDKLTKEEARAKMPDPAEQPEELIVGGNIKDQVDPVLDQLTFMELVDVCKGLNINIPRRCKYNQLKTIISKTIQDVEELLEVVENVTSRTVRKDEGGTKRNEIQRCRSEVIRDTGCCSQNHSNNGERKQGTC